MIRRRLLNDVKIPCDQFWAGCDTEPAVEAGAPALIRQAHLLQTGVVSPADWERTVGGPPTQHVSPAAMSGGLVTGGLVAGDHVFPRSLKWPVQCGATRDGTRVLDMPEVAPTPSTPNPFEDKAAADKATGDKAEVAAARKKAAEEKAAAKKAAADERAAAEKAAAAKSAAAEKAAAEKAAEEERRLTAAAAAEKAAAEKAAAEKAAAEKAAAEKAVAEKAVAEKAAAVTPKRAQAQPSGGASSKAAIDAAQRDARESEWGLKEEAIYVFKLADKDHSGGLDESEIEAVRSGLGQG